MATEASDRHHLYDAARQSWGSEAADTLMDLLPPDGDAAATKAHVTLLGSELRTEIAEVRTEMADVRIEMAELRSEMAGLGSELRSEMAGLASELRSEMAGLSSDLRCDMADFRAEIRTGMGALRTDLQGDVQQMGAEMYKAMADQTRTFVLANVGMIFSGIGLAFAAARFAGN